MERLQGVDTIKLIQNECLSAFAITSSIGLFMMETISSSSFLSSFLTSSPQLFSLEIELTRSLGGMKSSIGLLDVPRECASLCLSDDSPNTLRALVLLLHPDCSP
ncbi:hypothetical protein MTR67_029223 [Solanum verrucosum]|uniref:Uncharacterized protein n=1 Tax=Solanum verrucosum TaxID=315347 RepID=A0AAF0R8B5_SOLVR|nr:hypothetical protein MTR67_029223 [Solanum verrucosum]